MRSKVTRCKHCNKPVALNETAWASRDGIYCSDTCGIEDAKKLYSSKEYMGTIHLNMKAKAYFKDVAEEISREDYGARLEHFTAYDEAHDISTIFAQIYEGDTLVSISAVGWYYGTPSKDNDEQYIGKLTATFVD